MILRPSLTITLGDVLTGRYLVNVSRTHDNRWIVLNTDKSIWSDLGRRVPLVPPFRFGVFIYEESSWSEALPDIKVDKFYSRVQPMPHREWLLVRGRTSGPHEPNGDVYDREGNLVRSIFLDDGIEDVQTTSEGDIWVSYFDEGVFGGGRYSGCGLVCFGSDGNPRLRFTPEVTERFGVPDICDCYAMNVCENGETWASYYTDFPVVKFKGISFKEAWIDFPGKAIRAFAAGRDKLLILPAYQKTSALYLCDMDNRTIEAVTAVDESGSSFEFDLAIARNAALGFVCASSSKRPTLIQYDI